MKRLITICEEIVADPQLRPRKVGEIITTYCNVAVRRIAVEMGYTGFASSMTANDMIAHMRQHWLRTTAEDARTQACAGKLAIAAQTGTQHGHVAVIYPDVMGYSESWKKLVPMIANVGKTNGILRTSQAFMTEPDYYVLA